MQSDRLPPQNIEAEEAILGGILLDPEAINRVTELLRPEFFAIQAHQIIYKAMWQLYSQGKPTDLMTVTSLLSDNNQLEKIGGQVKIVQLLERTVSAVNIDQYAALVVDKYIRRKLIQAGNEIFDLGFQTATKLETILDQAEQKIFALTQDKPQQDLVPISETLIDTFQEIEDRNEGVALPGLACGFYDLDAMTGGFQRSDLIIVAGRPSMGKCAAYDTLVLQKDGSLITLAEVYQRQEIELLTLGKNRRFHLTKPSAFVDDGIKPVFRVTTKLGRFVETTITHPFLTVDGWKPLAKLQVGEKIAVPRQLDIFGNETIPESEFSSLIDSDNFCLFPLVFKLERSQLALFIRYLFSLDGWMKISEDGGVDFGYSAVSEKFIRQVQHILLRFGIVAAIKKVEEKRSETKKVVNEFQSYFCDGYLRNSTEKICFKRCDFRQNYFDKNLWHLTIIDPLSQKNFIADIGGLDYQNLDFHSSCLDLIAENNFLDEQSENKEIFWHELISLMEKLAVPKSLSVKSRNGKITSPKNFDNLTTTDTFYGKNFLVDMESLLLENLDLDSDRLTLPRLENSWWEKLESREIFCNELLSLVTNFAVSKNLSVEKRSIKRKSDKTSKNLTTTDTFYGKNFLVDMESLLLENLDFGSDRLTLARLENSWWEKLESREIFCNELLSLVTNFAVSKNLSVENRSIKRKSEKIYENLTTSDTFCRKSLRTDMESLPLESLDFGSDRLTLARLENSWWEKLESREIFCNELLSLMKNFPSENLDFGLDRLTLARLENSWWEKLESREIFCNELLSLVSKFSISKNQLLKSTSVKKASEKTSENLTTTDTFYGKNLLTDIENLPSKNLDFGSDRLTLVRLENAWREKLESLEILSNELLSLVATFAESQHPSVENRSVKRKSSKNSENLTTADTFYGKNFLADMGNFPFESLDFGSDRLALVRLENSWREKLESREILSNELLSLVVNFADSKHSSLKNRSIKRKSDKSEKNFENLTTTDTFYGKNFLADMESLPLESIDFGLDRLALVRLENSWWEKLESRDILLNELLSLMKNFPSESLDFVSDKLTLVRLENSWWEKLESRDILSNELLSLVVNFAESKYSSVENRSIKRKSDKNSENLIAADTFCRKNFLADMGNFPLESLDFGSGRLTLVRLENSWCEKLESREIFCNELLSLVAKFAISKNQLLKSTSVKKASEKTSENLTTTDTFYGKNLLTDIESLLLESLDFGSDRLTLVRLENSWREKLESREIFWNELLSLVAKFAISKNQLLKNRSVKKTSEKNSENLTTADTFYGKNCLADIKSLLLESLDFGSDRLTLVRLENAWREKLESLEILSNELLSLVTNFAVSKHASVENINVKGKSDQTSENLTTTDTFYGKNLLADMENLLLESLDFGSDILTLVRLENSWWEKLESREIFCNELLSLVVNFAESKHSSLKSTTVKRKSDKISENLTTTDTFCRKNLLTDIKNIPSENLDFHSDKFNLAKPDNLWKEQLENTDIFWDEIVSIEPVGEKQVYDLTVPETHNFVANDICLHNTSFAVNIGHSIAANQKLPVAIFSLEMSKEQLVLRLLASEARIESNRLRSGRISQNEWEPLTSAIGNLSEMPIFIDDTPNITVNEIRSKTRQLQSEQGGALGLILLDYLQLMEGSNSDNRVLELARITRNLKGLARELSVPIIALSQLSRSVESRTNKRPMMSDLRESGCLTGETLIYLIDGKKIPISRLVGKSNFPAFALNEKTGKFESAMVSRVFSTGVKPIFRLQTASGKLIRATANHPFFSMDGWQQLNSLNIGDSLAILNQKMLKCSILYCGQFLSQADFRPKSGGNLASVVKSREWEGCTEIDVEWDEIVEIMPDGEAEVFDLTVPGLHNFVANELVVHNSIEQDADLVIMLYRDEYYSPDTPDQGIAEVIITKHRNGPTGTVKLLFDPQFTKFRNLAVNKR